MKLHYCFHSDQEQQRISRQTFHDELDTPEHCLMCGKITREESQFENTNYKDIFSQSVSKQAAIVQLIATLLERREVASALSTGPSHGPIQDNDSN